MKIGFVSLGCPKNLVDGEVMLGMAREAGHEITSDAQDADVIVVNTCAFIDNAKEESVDAILEMAQLKRDGKARKLIVTGCLAERYREQLKAEIPEIDACLDHLPDAGFNVLNWGKQKNIVEVKQRVGDRMCLMGNVNPLEIGVRGTPEEVREATLEVLEGAGGEGIILSVGGGTSPGMPRQNILAMLDALEEFNASRRREHVGAGHG